MWMKRNSNMPVVEVQICMAALEKMDPNWYKGQHKH